MVNGVSYLKRNFSWTEVIIKEPDSFPIINSALSGSLPSGSPEGDKVPTNTGQDQGKSRWSGFF